MNIPDKKTSMSTPAMAPSVALPADAVAASALSKAAKGAVKKAVEPVAKAAASAAVKSAKVIKAVAAPKASLSAALPVPEPLKPGRRSPARTSTPSTPSAPMVPSHSPDAAKASYSTMPERLITPHTQPAAPKDPKLANNWKSKPADQLSDEEVKAMSDDEYMNEAQLAFFRHKLSILKQEIHNSAGETTEHLREDAAVVPDPADRATIEEEHALELRTRDRERKLLKKIEQSIARIDSGDYGYCDETGEPIGVGRLIARPTANLSLEAQQRRELKQKMFGD
ncbi:MAG: RNA polymerase-binding protein DksA [Pseudomonadota bacterium]|nr:RNA polymerase-binding protein DksA [Pseudomonadota bacterium]